MSLCHTINCIDIFISQSWSCFGDYSFYEMSVLLWIMAWESGILDKASSLVSLPVVIARNIGFTQARVSSLMVFLLCSCGCRILKIIQFKFWIDELIVCEWVCATSRVQLMKWILITSLWFLSFHFEGLQTIPPTNMPLPLCNRCLNIGV